MKTLIVLYFVKETAIATTAKLIMNSEEDYLMQSGGAGQEHILTEKAALEHVTDSTQSIYKQASNGIKVGPVQNNLTTSFVRPILWDSSHKHKKNQEERSDF